MFKRFPYSSLIGMLIASIITQPILSYADSGGENKVALLQRALQDHSKLAALADGFRALGEQYTARKREVGLQQAREELKGALSEAAKEEIAAIEKDASLDREQRRALSGRINERLLLDFAEVEATANFAQFFAEKANRLLDRDVNFFPFEDDDSGGESFVDLMLIFLTGVGIFVFLIGTLAGHYSDTDDEESGLKNEPALIPPYEVKENPPSAIEGYFRFPDYRESTLYWNYGRYGRFDSRASYLTNVYADVEGIDWIEEVPTSGYDAAVRSLCAELADDGYNLSRTGRTSE